MIIGQELRHISSVSRRAFYISHIIYALKVGHSHPDITTGCFETGLTLLILLYCLFYSELNNENHAVFSNNESSD